MKPRLMVGTAGLTLALSAWLSAQLQDTFIVTTDHAVMEVSANGVILNTLKTVANTAYFERAVQSPDNRSVLVAWIDFTNPPGTFRIAEISSGGSEKTLWSGPMLGPPQALYPDDDGDWILVTRYLDFYRLRGTSLTSLSRMSGFLCTGGVVSQDAGHLVIRAQTGLQSTLSAGFFSVDPYARAVTTLTTCHPHSFGIKDLIYEGDTGTYIDADQSIALPPRQIPSSLVRVIPGAGMVKLPVQGLVDYASAIAPAGPRTRLIGVAYHALERDRTPVPQTTVITGLMSNGSRFGSVTISGFPSLSSRLYMFRRGERHLAWTMDQRPNDRSLRVSFPGEGGRSYVVALSATGTRPGPALPDGRVIPLIVDGLVSQCLNGGIPGILENTAGVLNATGEARVKVHVNPFGAALKGVKLWAAALVLDANAPSGVAAVVGPLVVTVK